MPGRGRRGRRGRGRGRRGRGRQMNATPVFTPVVTPRVIELARPVIANTEMKLSITDVMSNILSLDKLRQEVTAQLGLRPLAPNTQVFSISLLTIQFWLIPTGNNTAYGELTLHILDPQTEGTGVLRALRSYGSRDVSARIGYHYPPRVRSAQLNVANIAQLVRGYHSISGAGNLTLLTRIKSRLILFGNNVTPTMAENIDEQEEGSVFDPDEGAVSFEDDA